MRFAPIYLFVAITAFTEVHPVVDRSMLAEAQRIASRYTDLGEGRAA